MNALTRRRGRSGATADDLAALKAAIVRGTGALPQGPLRPDWRRLTDEERGDLVALASQAEDLLKADDAAAGFSFAAFQRLGRHDRDRAESLVEKAAGVEAGLFAHERDIDALRRDVAELSRRAHERPIRREAQDGLFDLLVEQMQSGFLFIPHAAIVALVLASFHSGRPLSPTSRFETVDGEPVLVIRSDHGLFGGALDPEGVFSSWRTLLEHAVANAWFTIDKHGNEWRIGLGSRGRRALGRPR